VAPLAPTAALAQLAALSPTGVTARPAKIKEPELRQMAIVLRAALDREEPFTIM
jgi:hypothetical protein